jgi:hypothetical protein
MRHQEAAALCVRHIDFSKKPLAQINIVQAFDSREREVKSTKDEATRQVPMHPVLAKVVRAWLQDHWPRIYGRKPGPDDFVVPTRNMTCVNVADAGHALTEDLLALGFRTSAGKTRKRGGHDLRAWFETQLLEDGADSLIAGRFTHAVPKDVKGGYTRVSWSALCRELGKLKVKLRKVLPVVTESLQAEAKARGRWQKSVTPKGLEPYSALTNQFVEGSTSDEKRAFGARAGVDKRDHAVTNVTNPGRRWTRLGKEHAMRTAARMLQRALDMRDTARMQNIIRDMAEADTDV